MYKTITICCILIASYSFGQNFDEQWKEVYKLELDGKIQSAQKEVQEIYKKAKRKKEEVQIIKCFFYVSKFEQVLNEKAQSTIISTLKEEIKEAKPASKALLNYIYATLLQNYYNQNSYKIGKRNDLENQKSTDFSTWSTSDFIDEIEKAMENSLQNEKSLRATTINDYKEIFEVSPSIDAKNYSLYDFLVEKNMAHYKSKIKNFDQKNKSDLFQNLYAESTIFVLYNLTLLVDDNLIKLLKILQNNERYYLSEKKEKADFAYFERLKYFHSLFSEYSVYPEKIKQLENITSNSFLKQSLRIERIKNYMRQTSKNNKINKYKEALALIDTVLNTKINPNTLAEAETLQNQILQKSLSVRLQTTTYPNQNNRAFLDYKNVDSIKISYYHFPVKNNYLLTNSYTYSTNYKNNKDSLIINYIQQNKPIKSFTRKLTSSNDFFNHSTEIILEKIDVGNYLVFLETTNDTIEKKIAFTYENFQVSNFFIVEDKNEKYDLIYVLDKKTGKPIENVSIKNEDETVYTNKEGKAQFRLRKQIQNKIYNNDILIIKENDTLLKKYHRTFIYEREENNEDDFDNFEAKAMVYFDRAIYRPGQKIHYKGILIQNKDNIKSVVPYVSIHVEINDVNENILKEFDVQTNEFGSFSGEFDIPKNTLTGNFYITIDEADNYEVDAKYYDSNEEEHKFWDNVDFDVDNFYFKVEEYKRPTFEIIFDEIKENYTISDTIKIKGKAKALAGNNLTNAKVAYTVSKKTTSNKSSFSDDDDFIIAETATDENGNFNIQFPAIEEGVSNDSILLIRYTVKIDVTDIQGETRSAFKYIKVAKEMLELNVLLNSNLFKEDDNKIIIKSTTLNNYTIDSKGEIKIYELQKSIFLKNRLFGIPEIQTLSRNEFEQLFPHEPFDQSDYETKEVLVKTISFDTKTSNEISFDFLKSFKNGYYKVVTEAYDKKNNLIKTEKNFNLDSKVSPNTKDELFTFKDTSKPNGNLFEIEILSPIPDLWITSRFYGENNTLENEQVVQLKNGKAILKFNKKSEYKTDVYFHFSSVWENSTAEKTHSIQKETIEPKLNFEIVSMRNKIEPGSLENWSFKIIDQKLESEVLASMYDRSLDQFDTQNWSTVNFSDSSDYTNFPDLKFANISYKTFNNFKMDRKYYSYYIQNPQINWFGFNYTYPKNSQTQKKYLDKIKPLTELPKNAKNIIGIILDDSGMPLPGASVIIKNTNRGTSTDFDGQFNIEAAPGEVLFIGFVGYNSIEIIIGNKKDYYINLKDSENYLEEVVVTGAYGIKKKEKSVTYASQSMNSNTLAEMNATDLITALTGEISGVQVTNSSGVPGSSTRIILRGASSIKGDNQPLYVIDGVPFEGDSSTLDLENIKEISVLKGPSAAALYGLIGANGVVIITTKDAFKELSQVKTRTNFNETAFFYPHLKTDSDGKFSFNFNTPESLTTWKLRLYGHNKKTESGYFESTIISQKDLMVQTNMPRFVREKDTISISAKVVNMTNDTKSGIAMLMLFDATNMKAIDSIALNPNNIRNFDCKPKESVPVTWKITIPEGLQGLQYKIVAKSGNYSDGEENILPVMSNKILITESIPIWVKRNSKKEYVFENLKNNSSSTLKNHQFTLEYTSNPTWLALQSLPYLMEFQHECAEQTFSRYYGNFIATEIINSNPKIATLFESWKTNSTSVSKLNQNEELKSIVLNETPWLLDAESEELKNNRLALLMDLNTMKESQENTFKKLEEKQLSSGAFPWFDGGDENMFITQHIIAGLGHLGKLFPESISKFEKITSKAIPHLDNNFIKTSTLKNERINYYTYSNLHYLYARSFYIEKLPVSKKTDSIITIQKVEFKANWLQYSLYKKALLALTMYRLGDKDFAKNIIANLKETVAINDDFGMYWIENKNGYYWHQSSIETQALLIEAFAEIEKDKKYVDEMKVWLLKQKQLQNWPTTKATTEAVYALLLQGNDWINIKDNTKFKIGNEKVLTKKLTEKDKEAETGYIKINWNSDEITKEMGSISVENKSSVAGFGGLYWQYFENLENIKSDSTAILSVTKNVYKKVKSSFGNQLVELNKESLKQGDLITIRLIIKTENDLEFVHLKDLRASCFEPVDVISKYELKDGLRFYRSTKDVATHFFFDTIKRGTYVLEYDVRVNHSGSFIDGISTLQSMYAPEFSAHSISTKVKID
ncbi:MAG TPA: MG2 domain-containing protein [Flavobacterium sp.]|nr:MG2 domain-containing protein [Flavobacterium sp.]